MIIRNQDCERERATNTPTRTTTHAQLRYDDETCVYYVEVGHTHAPHEPVK